MSSSARHTFTLGRLQVVVSATGESPPPGGRSLATKYRVVVTGRRPGQVWRTTAWGTPEDRVADRLDFASVAARVLEELHAATEPDYVSSVVEDARGMKVLALARRARAIAGVARKFDEMDLEAAVEAARKKGIL